MRLRSLSALSLLVLVGCEQPLDETADSCPVCVNDVEEAPDPVEYTLDWDDPTYMPEVDRWAPENMLLIDVPLGTSIITDVDEWAITGESGGDRLGISVSAGNYLGYGREDVIMGSIWGAGSGSGDGAAYLWKAKAADTGDANKHVHRADASKARFYGSNGDKAGENVASGGDHDNNGADDILLGARNHTHATDTWKTNAGAVYVYSGAKGSYTIPASAFTIEGVKAFEYLGAGVAWIPDRNGDGYDELLIGATGGDIGSTDSGTVYLVNGPVTASGDINTFADATISGENSGDGAGARGQDAGDLNGDGTNDIVIGVRGEDTRGTDAGAVYIITGTTYPSDLGSSDTILRGNSDNSAAGNSVAAMGDINGDGVDDLGVGSLGHQGRGYAYIIYGSTAGITSGALGSEAQIRLYGQIQGDQFGSTVFAGDFDNDGDNDVGVAANRQGNTDRGAVYFFLDPATGDIPATSADAKVVGANSGDYTGSWVDVANNTDWWGYEKVVIGSSGRGTDDRGRVYLLEY